jgi:glutathione S-transferase
MPDAMHLSAAATIVAVAVYFLTLMYAGHVRHRTGLKAPAVVGNVEFERAYRVQMNTLESLPVLLPLLWIATVYFGGWIPAALGLLWALGRVVYMIDYLKSPDSRAAGFGIQFLAQVGLFGLAVWGLLVT